MPYNSKNSTFYNLVGTSITTTSGTSWDIRIKAALVKSLCRTRPEANLLSSYLNSTSSISDDAKGTFGKIIGAGVINPLYYPYMALQVTKASIFAILDGAPTENSVTKSLKDNNNWRIATKAVVQALFIIPEALSFAVAKVGDIVGDILEATGNAFKPVVDALKSVGTFLTSLFSKRAETSASVEEDKKEHKSSNPFSKLFNSNTNNNAKSARNEVKYEAVNTEEEKRSKSVEFTDIKKTERSTAPLATIDEAEEEHSSMEPKF